MPKIRDSDSGDNKDNKCKNKEIIISIFITITITIIITIIITTI